MAKGYHLAKALYEEIRLHYTHTVFTGLIQSVGRILKRQEQGQGAHFHIECDFANLELGESIAVSGCCLTVTAATGNSFTAEASEETLRRTALGRLAVGARVNLERAMSAHARFGGHMVSGHVDGVGTLRRTFELGLARGMTFQMPPAIARFVAEKGSICIDGISLTVNAVTDDTFDVAIIRHTDSVTTLQGIAIGAHVNLEVDLIARYVERLLNAPKADAKDATLGQTLTEKGYM
jgi:riboflavin synthase